MFPKEEMKNNYASLMTTIRSSDDTLHSDLNPACAHVVTIYILEVEECICDFVHPFSARRLSMIILVETLFPHISMIFVATYVFIFIYILHLKIRKKI